MKERSRQKAPVNKSRAESAGRHGKLPGHSELSSSKATGWKFGRRQNLSEDHEPSREYDLGHSMLGEEVKETA